MIYAAALLLAGLGLGVATVIGSFIGDAISRRNGRRS